MESVNSGSLPLSFLPPGLQSSSPSQVQFCLAGVQKVAEAAGAGVVGAKVGGRGTAEADEWRGLSGVQLLLPTLALQSWLVRLELLQRHDWAMGVADARKETVSVRHRLSLFRRWPGRLVQALLAGQRCARCWELGWVGKGAGGVWRAHGSAQPRPHALKARVTVSLCPFLFVCLPYPSRGEQMAGSLTHASSGS